MAMPDVGEIAPDFALPGPDGDSVRLSDFRERAHVLLAFYPFDFSPICSMQLPGLQAQLLRFRELETEVLGISTDSPHSHRAFAAELGLEFPLLSDFYGKAVSEAYGVLRPEGFCERASFIIDKAGVIRYAAIHDMDQVPDVEKLFMTLASLEDER
ncbi:MAG: redoxin domain-containing protein [Caldilineales bacterium]|nr:redoxin domain-containing protein [Caldilineales bacterium]